MPAKTKEEKKIEALALEEELVRIQLARLKLKYFAPYVYEWFKVPKHQEYLMEKLEQVEKFVASGGKEGIGKLLISIPPRHGKSLLCTEIFPSFFLGRNPDKRVLITSYGASLSEYFSRKVRDLVESAEYQKIFGKLAAPNPSLKQVNVDPDGRSAQSWDLDGHRGGLRAAGVGGAITGTGADVLIIDDPIKDDEEAQSEVIRKKVVDWYTSTALTRLQKGGAIIVVMTRWEEGDLAGWLLDKESEQWDVVVLPALALPFDPLGRKEGEVLWPEEYDFDHLMKKKAVMPARHWNALFQQSPSGEAGEVFNQNWFVYGSFPDINEISYGLQVWDCAMTEKEEGDYSACVTLYVTRSGVYVADVFRGHLAFPDLKQRMCDLYAHWNRVFRISRICIENRVAGTSVIQSLKKESHLPLIPLEPNSKLGKSKLQRAQSVSGYVQSGRVIFRKNASWLHEFEDELLKFPHGKHDDMVDSLVYGLIQVNGGGRPVYRSTGSSRYGFEMTTPRNRHDMIMGGM